MVDSECRQCKKVKDAEKDYYWSKGSKQTRCKSCMKEYSRTWQRGVQAKIVQSKLEKEEKLLKGV